MFKTKEKKERRLGIRLFLKPHRCASIKCAMVRSPLKPGQHTKMRRRAMSEFGEQLAEKQKLRYTYGLREQQLRRFFSEASKSKDETGPKLMQLLERRLDSTVFNGGIAPSRSVARNLINHGHIIVNGKKTKSPSYLVKVGDVIAVREQSKTGGFLKDSPIVSKSYMPPRWLESIGESFTIKSKTLPTDIDHLFDLEKIIDFYSK